MAYQDDPLLDPNRQNQNGGTPVISGGAGVMSGSATQGTGGPAAPAAPTSSNSFQNLNSYLDANQGQGFGQQFAGKMQGDVDAANQAQQHAGAQFQQASDQGSVKAQPGVVSDALSNPAQYVTDPNNVQAFENQYNAQYKGPNSYADLGSEYQKAYGATQNAQNVATASKSEPGRFALLDQYFGRSTRPDEYSQGQKSLDNLILQNDQGSQQAIEQARQNAQQAQQSFNQQGQDLSNYAAGNIQSTQAARQAARNAIGVNDQGVVGTTGALPEQQAAMASTLANDQALSAKNYAELQSLLGQGLTGPEIFAQHPELNLPGGVTTYGLNLTNYQNYLHPGINPTMSQATSAQDQARLDALEQLANLPQDAFTSGEAGTYDPNKNYFQLDPGAFANEPAHQLPPGYIDPNNPNIGGSGPPTGGIGNGGFLGEAPPEKPIPIPGWFRS